MYNKVTLIGHLGADPEIRTLENGAKVGKFSLATKESYKDKNGEWQDVTEWHNVVVWRDLAERAEKQLKKGGLVFVEGKVSTRKYQDKDGNDRYATDIVAALFRSLEKNPNSGQGSNFPSADSPYAAVTGGRTATPTEHHSGGGDNSSMGPDPSGDDGLPF